MPKTEGERLAFRGVLFDFDGTLFDTVPMIVETFQQVYRHFHLDLPSVAEIEATIGRTLEDVFSAYGEDLAPKLLDAYLRFNRPLLTSHVGIYCGIGPMLDALRAEGLALGIVSAKRRNSLLPTLKAFEMAAPFDCLVSKDDTQRHKPDPEPLLLGMQKLGVSDPSDILYVGDSVFDIQAAKRGGFSSCAVAWGAGEEEALKAQAPSFFIRRAEELPQLLRHKSGRML